MKFNPDGSVEMSVEEFKAMNGVNPVSPVMPMALSVASVTPAFEPPNSVTRSKRGRKPLQERPEMEVYELLKKSSTTYPNGWGESAIVSTINKGRSTVGVHLRALESQGLIARAPGRKWVYIPSLE